MYIQFNLVFKSCFLNSSGLKANFRCYFTAEIGSNCQGPSSAKACEGMNGAGCRGGKCQCNGDMIPAPNKRSCMPRPPPICGPGKTLSPNKMCVPGKLKFDC